MKPPSITVPSADYKPADAFCGLRDMILRLPAERSASGFAGMVGALMETGHQGAVATLVMLSDRTTSLYLSNGGGVIGAGAHKPVAEAAARFLQAAEKSTNLMQPTSDFPLPKPQHSRFYILSTTGAWTSESPDQDLGKNRLPLSPLFHLAHAVITAIRQNIRPPGAA